MVLARDGGQRQGVLLDHNFKRDALLLHTSTVCHWRKCKFCEYWKDNLGSNVYDAVRKNWDLLKKVTGEYKRLQVCCSGSFEELPSSTIVDILKVCTHLGIKEVYAEQCWAYADRNKQWVDIFKKNGGIKLKFALGAEALDLTEREFLHKEPMGYKGQTKGGFLTQCVNLHYGAINLLYGYQGCPDVDEFIWDVKLASMYMDFVHVLVYSQVGAFKEDQKKISAFIKKTPGLLYELPNVGIYLQNETSDRWMDQHNKNIVLLQEAQKK